MTCKFTKLDPPHVLVLGFALGALLTPYGMMNALGHFGGPGLYIMVIGADNALAATTTPLLGGNLVPFLTIIGLFVALTIMGIVAGSIRVSMENGGSKAK